MQNKFLVICTLRKTEKKVKLLLCSRQCACANRAAVVTRPAKINETPVSKQGEGVAIPCICGGGWSRHHMIKSELMRSAGLGTGR